MLKKGPCLHSHAFRPAVVDCFSAFTTKEYLNYFEVAE